MQPSWSTSSLAAPRSLLSPNPEGAETSGLKTNKGLLHWGHCLGHYQMLVMMPLLSYNKTYDGQRGWGDDLLQCGMWEYCQLREETLMRRQFAAPAQCQKYTHEIRWGLLLRTPSMRAARDRNKSVEQDLSSVGPISGEWSLFFCGRTKISPQISPQNIDQILPKPPEKPVLLRGVLLIFGDIIWLWDIWEIWNS